MRRKTGAAAFFFMICLLLTSCGKNQTSDNGSSSLSDTVSDYGIMVESGEISDTSAVENSSSGEIITDALSGSIFIGNHIPHSGITAVIVREFPFAIAAEILPL